MKNNTIRATVWCTNGTVGNSTMFLVLNSRIAISSIVATMKVMANTTFQVICPKFSASDGDVCALEKDDPITSEPKVYIADTQCDVANHRLAGEEIVGKVQLGKICLFLLKAQIQLIFKLSEKEYEQFKIRWLKLHIFTLF